MNAVESFTLIRHGPIDTGWHQHAEHQLLYAEGGVLYVSTRESQFLLPAFHGAWIPAVNAHKLVSPSEKTNLWLIYFQTKKKEPASFQGGVRIFGLSSLAREMLRYTERWSTEGEESDPLARSYYRTIRLLAAEWCEAPLSLVLPHVEEGILGEVTQYVIENFGDLLRIEDVAQIHGVSGRTLMRLFNSRLGMTFGAYLRTVRIVKAVELLTSPSASVLEVAYDVGYSSPSSFSQAFRRLTGLSPKEYTRRR